MRIVSDWHVDGSLPMSGYTQTSRTKVVGSDEIAYFGHPFEYELYYRADDERDRGLMNCDKRLIF